jgi:hypothetical protein
MVAAGGEGFLLKKREGAGLIVAAELTSELGTVLA